MSTPTYDPADAVPKKLRTWCYGIGALLGIGIAPSLLALGLTTWAGVAVGMSGAANAIAFGYRPTRQAAPTDTP